jgi:hypothetical protein
LGEIEYLLSLYKMIEKLKEPGTSREEIEVGTL